MPRILIALDESPVSKRAAQAAVDLFGPTSEYLVVDVAAVPVPWVGATGFGAVTAMPMPPAWTDPPAPEEDAADLASRAERAGVPDPQAVVRTGDAVAQVCAAAEEHDVDVVVVGSHDKSALRRLVDPSVAAGIVRGTHRPVLVVSGEPPSQG